jgi:hypothetical protein
MKRLVEQAEPGFAELGKLVASEAPHAVNPFAKKLVQSRLSRAIAGGVSPRPALRPALIGAGVVLFAATAAAASYSWLAPSAPVPPAAVVASVVPPAPQVTPAPAPRTEAPAPVVEEPAEAKPAERRAEKPRAGEDPTQVAEAVRALRKQGDPARAQAMLDQYLKSNPRGALAEDALALSIEAAAARKDPRAAEYARRYLVRYPNGRFRAMAERAAAR